MKDYPYVEHLGGDKFKVFGKETNQKPKIALSSLSLILFPLFLTFDFLDSGDYEVIGTIVKLSLGFAMVYSFIKDYRFWRDFNTESKS